MKTPFTLSAFLAATVLLSLSAWAAKPIVVSDEFANTLSKLARENITKAQQSDGAALKSETAEEKTKPILPLDDEKRVIQHGILSGIRESCKESWKEDFSAFMKGERAKHIWTRKQMAYMGLLHGAAMGLFEGQIQQHGGCTPHLREYL